MTKEELLKAIYNDSEFANQLAHALLSQCTLVCNTRNDRITGNTLIGIELTGSNRKIILEDTCELPS